LCPFAACSNRTYFVMVSAPLCLRTQVLLCRGAHAYGISRGCVSVPSLACWRFGPVIALPPCSFRCELRRHGRFRALHVCPLIVWLACVLSAWPLAHLLTRFAVCLVVCACLSVCLTVSVSISVCLSASLRVRPSVCLSACLLVRVSVRPFVWECQRARCGLRMRSDEGARAGGRCHVPACVSRAGGCQSRYMIVGS